MTIAPRVWIMCAVFAGVVGAICIGTGLAMDRWHDARAFHAAYNELSNRRMEDFPAVPAPDVYDRLLENHGTVRYDLLEWGGLALVFALGCAVIGRGFAREPTWHVAESSAYAWKMAAMTALLMLLHLVMASVEQRFPWWADSLSIPFFGLIFMTPLLVVIIRAWQYLMIGQVSLWGWCGVSSRGVTLVVPSIGIAIGLLLTGLAVWTVAWGVLWLGLMTTLVAYRGVIVCRPE
jgi:hypothetical protein